MEDLISEIDRSTRGTNLALSNLVQLCKNDILSLVKNQEEIFRRLELLETGPGSAVKSTPKQECSKEECLGNVPADETSSEKTTDEIPCSIMNKFPSAKQEWTLPQRLSDFGGKKVLLQVAEARLHQPRDKVTLDRHVWGVRLRGKGNFRVLALLVDENKKATAKMRSLKIDQWIILERYRLSQEDPPTLSAHGWEDFEQDKDLSPCTTESGQSCCEIYSLEMIVPEIVNKEIVNKEIVNKEVVLENSDVEFEEQDLISDSEEQMLKESSLASSHQEKRFKKSVGRCVAEGNAEKKKVETKGIAARSVVRKKAERKNLQGYDCSQCKSFYEAVGEDLPKNVACEASRHRYVYEPPSTPPGFWNLSFPPTQL